MSTALIVLAAGKGTRMKSDLPKVMHPIAGAPMLIHALRAGTALEPSRIVVVTGHSGEMVEAAAIEYDPEILTARQEEQLGTAHAVAQARGALAGHDGDALVLYGDTPFIQPETLERMIDARRTHDVVVLGFEAADPGRYGRLVMHGESLEKIVEFKEASREERAITFCNSGVIAANSEALFQLIDAVGNDNEAGEYYLTDIVAIARQQGLSATAIACGEAETLGINSRRELAAAEALFQSRAREESFENGVSFYAPDSVYFSFDTVIGRDALIEQNVVFGPGVTLENGAHIRAFTHLEGCHIARGAIVGPYARLRPGAELGEDVRIGNFVEIKNAVLDTGAKVNHLSYIGDAHLGAASNIGAGTVICNYDGVLKHRTKVGAGAFIGSGTMLVSPVEIGDHAMTASGSVITHNVPEGALGLGRARQVNKPGLARKLVERFKSIKAKRDEGAS